MKRLLIILLLFSSLAQAQNGQALFFELNGSETFPVTTGVKAHYQADRGVTGTSTVTAWADQSGNGYTLTAPAGKEPTLVTPAVNGYPALSFSADRLINSTLSLTAPYSMLIIGKVNSSDADGGCFFDTYQSTGGAAAIYRSFGAEGNNFVMYAGGAAASYPSNNNFNLFIGVVKTAAGYFTLNGATPNPFAPGTNPLNGVSIGDVRGAPGPIATGYSLDGWVAEVVIFDRDLSAAEILKLQTFYKNKYNLW